MQTGIYHLVVAMGILIATALGVVLGGWLTLGPATLSTSPSAAMQLTLSLDGAGGRGLRIRSVLQRAVARPVCVGPVAWLAMVCAI